MCVKDKDDAQWMRCTPFAEVNIEVKTDSKWSPAYFSAELLVASTVFREYLPKEGIQPDDIIQKRSQRVQFRNIFIIAIIFFSDLCNKFPFFFIR